MFEKIKAFFKPKFKVPVTTHSDAIVDRMIRQGHTWTGQNKHVMRYCFWAYVEHEFGAKQEYSWRKSLNYMVFNSEQDYLIFLLKL